MLPRNSLCAPVLDINGRPNSSASASASPSQKSLTGGLSCLFSTPVIKSASFSAGSEDLGFLWHDRTEELGSTYRYSSSSSSSKRDQAHQSPVSVLQGPNSSAGLGSRSPPLRFSADFSSIRSGSGVMFNSFVRHALGSRVDYDLSDMAIDDKDFNLPSSSSDELTFNMEDNFMELDLPAYAVLLSDAQSRHLIFRDDFVVKAFYEAEKAHRGQKRASGHPYLQHCLETAMLLAEIGANSTVVAAGPLHDTIDDSFVTYEQISRSFGAGVADLVEGEHLRRIPRGQASLFDWSRSSSLALNFSPRVLESQIGARKVSKLSQLSKLARENNTANKTIEADRLHTMFLAMADARAVLIKLADRLHNMNTIGCITFDQTTEVCKGNI